MKFATQVDLPRANAAMSRSTNDTGMQHLRNLSREMLRASFRSQHSDALTRLFVHFLETSNAREIMTDITNRTKRTSSRSVRGIFRMTRMRIRHLSRRLLVYFAKYILRLHCSVFWIKIFKTKLIYWDSLTFMENICCSMYLYIARYIPMANSLPLDFRHCYFLECYFFPRVRSISLSGDTVLSGELSLRRVHLRSGTETLLLHCA